MSHFVHAAWGKFRGFQRTLPADEQLSRADLGVAWGLWKILTSPLEDEAAREAARAYTEAQDEAGQLACRAFALWLQENQERLASLQERAVAESAHMTDHVSAQLIR